MDYFGYYNPSLLAKRLYETNLAKNKKIINVINDALIDLRNIVNKNKIPKNENHCKVMETHGIKLEKSYIICIEKRKLQKKCITT